MSNLAEAIELKPPTKHASWEEILERGYIVSELPRIVGLIDNPDEFAAIPELDFRLEGNIDLSSPLDSINSSLARYAPPIIPLLATIAEDALRINPDLRNGSPRNNSWQFRIQVPAAEASIHMDSSHVTAGQDPKKLAKKPEDEITYTVGTSGSLFYPSRFEFYPVQAGANGSSIKERIRIINASIRRIVQDVKPTQASPFTIVQFNGLTQHSADFRPKSNPGDPPPEKRRVLVASFGC